MSFAVPHCFESTDLAAFDDGWSTLADQAQADDEHGPPATQVTWEGVRFLVQCELTGATRSGPTRAGCSWMRWVSFPPPGMQAKLLRALQEKCVFRLGAEKTTQSDFRILAATNRYLYADMNAGRFRADLFCRLAVIKIE